MSTPEQLGLTLPHTVAMGRDDFLIAPSNRLALAQIDAFDAPGLCVITGPRGTGKTHLAAIWAARHGAAWVAPSDLPALLPGLLADDGPLAIALDDADTLTQTPDAPEALFHLINHLRGRGRLLMTAQRGPAGWGLTLPDLASRLATAAQAPLDEPDEALLAAVLVKQFADRQINVDPRVIEHCVSRMERSLGAARDLVDRLDRTALARKKPITRKLAGEMLDAMDKPDPPRAS